MLFGTGKRLSNLQSCELSLSIRGTSINHTSQYKYLGVYLDPPLSMQGNFDKIRKKASSRLGLLKKIRPNLNPVVALRIYQAFISPVISYCSLVNSFSSETRLEWINQFERRANAVIGGNEFAFTPFKVTDKLNLCLFTYKCIHGLHCDNFENYFSLLLQQRSTRSNNTSVRLPRVNLEAARKGSYFRGGKVFNSLPTSIRELETLKEFKSLCKQHLLDT